MSTIDKNHYCPVCSHTTCLLGSQYGKLDKQEFFIRHCDACHFSYVANPRSDFHEIYNEDYYRGLGGDDMIDYVYELQNASTTIRNYEWKGIVALYRKLAPKGGRWLDYGCGDGGLVKYARKLNIDVIGFEEGWAAEFGRSLGIPILSEGGLEPYFGTFDFISAIEVFEHIPSPYDALESIRNLLKPNGILFLTTGNAKPWRKKILEWNYTQCPDVHVSFFEPETLELCLKKVGLLPKKITMCGGLKDITPECYLFFL